MLLICMGHAVLLDFGKNKRSFSFLISKRECIRKFARLNAQFNLV